MKKKIQIEIEYNHFDIGEIVIYKNKKYKVNDILKPTRDNQNVRYKIYNYDRYSLDEAIVYDYQLHKNNEDDIYYKVLAYDHGSVISPQLNLPKILYGNYWSYAPQGTFLLSFSSYKDASKFYDNNKVYSHYIYECKLNGINTSEVYRKHDGSSWPIGTVQSYAIKLTKKVFEKNIVDNQIILSNNGTIWYRARCVDDIVEIINGENITIECGRINWIDHNYFKFENSNNTYKVY